MKKIKQSAVERLIGSLEKRIKTYNQNKNNINERYMNELAKENIKISDATLQLKALKK